MILFGAIAAIGLAAFAVLADYLPREDDVSEAAYLVSRHGPKLTPANARSIVNAAREIGASPRDLAALISFETGGSFRPDQKNSIDAIGLIQFTKTTAKSLGTSVEALSIMTFDQQMEYVKRYFRQWSGPFSLHRLSMAVFYPPAMDQAEDWPFPSVVTKYNPGITTPAHYLAFVRRRL